MYSTIVKFIGAVAVTSIAVSSIAFAQAPAPSSAPQGASQLPETRGTVQRFTLTPIGELDGVILADGTEVDLPPHLTTQLANAVRVGDTVTVQGYRSFYVPLIVAAAISDAHTGQTVVDTGPPPPGSRPPPPPPGMPAAGAQQMTVQGKVRQQLYGPRGDLNGALLDDGTIVRIGPMEAYQVAPLFNPGQTLAVQGWGLTTAYGNVVGAQAIGPSAGQMTQLGPPMPPGYVPAASLPR
jgi:hypothetical protein